MSELEPSDACTALELPDEPPPAWMMDSGRSPSNESQGTVVSASDVGARSVSLDSEAEGSLSLEDWMEASGRYAASMGEPEASGRYAADQKEADELLSPVSPKDILSPVPPASPSKRVMSPVPPASPSKHVKPGKSVVIFDWDDTLFPTWYITDVVWPCIGKEASVPVDSPFWDGLSAHAQAVKTVLTAARKCARVAIITLAQRPWVNTSAEICLPGLDLQDLLEELDIPVLYAREHVSPTSAIRVDGIDGVSCNIIAKRNAMVKCLKMFGGQHGKVSNVISVGDSLVEKHACKEVAWSKNDLLCKTVKLLVDPPLPHLTSELQVLSGWLCQMLLHEEDFDISLESLSDGEDAPEE
eukprot:CAMPEP_0195160652 /NCGR_PEP_ID=MMETSP0448-20130528/186773_1 /TAXON_ID=66468 /ORGANISM="Heterocapsa triquestra, Strain CCMP 448" /LENGTH=355 /DNA_ID=CAMNT_0040199453 /DNA_START=67 /DNA_END=1135 /DNA_ORIENTATION=+